MRTCTAGLLLLSAGIAGTAHGSDSNYERHIAADPHGMVEISNVAGLIEVTGWDKAEIEVRADLGSEAERVDVESNHGRVFIRVVGAHPSFGGPATDLHVRAPRGSELSITSVNADIQTSDIEGGLRLSTVSGSIRADVFQKGAEAKTVSGDLVLRGRGKDAGDGGLHVSSISGSIRVERAGGDLEATTVSGDMTLRLDHGAHEVRIRSTSGDVGFEGRLSKDGNLEAQTVSGDLSVRTNPEGAFEYEVKTFSGEIRNCMGQRAERVSQYAPGRRLSGAQGPSGNEASRIRLRSMSGDVELCTKG